MRASAAQGTWWVSAAVLAGLLCAALWEDRKAALAAALALVGWLCLRHQAALSQLQAATASDSAAGQVAKVRELERELQQQRRERRAEMEAVQAQQIQMIAKVRALEQALTRHEAPGPSLPAAPPPPPI